MTSATVSSSVRRVGAPLLAALLLAACTAASPGATAPTPSPASTSPLPVASEAATLERQFQAVVQRVGPSVVLISTESGLGSGIVFDSAGHIVTNAHVVAGASSLRVLLANGRSYAATLEGQFTPDDLAVIKVDAGQLQAATFADSDQLKVGSIVMAIGNPLGLQSSVTEGIVSALGRQVVEPQGTALPPAIQTSADINPGNSGGALVNLEGEVVGIPTLAAEDPLVGGTVPGIGFAIPSNVVKDIAQQIIANGRVVNSRRAYLGIQSAPIEGGGGVLVYATAPGGPAARAGVQPGEIIVSLGGRPISDPVTLSSVLAGLQPGQAVEVVLAGADGTRRSVMVTLGELPAA